jgi:hypothetical protein
MAAPESVMFGLVKIAGLSAVLSAGLVNAYTPAPETGAKLYQDRIVQSEAASVPLVRTAAYTSSQDNVKGLAGKADSLRGCASQTWPNISPDCVSPGAAPARAAVRTITIEKRDGGNTSVLVRLPTDLAGR